MKFYHRLSFSIKFQGAKRVVEIKISSDVYLSLIIPETDHARFLTKLIEQTTAPIVELT